MFKLGFLRVAAAALLAMFLLSSTGVWAQSSGYDIAVRGISISPTEPVIGDTIRITTTFRVDSPTSNLQVALRLFVDDVFQQGNTYTVTVGETTVNMDHITSSMSSGDHKIRVEAELKADGSTKDTDTETRTLKLTSITATHNLDIIQVRYPAATTPGERVTIEVSVNNSGNVAEENVQIQASFGGSTKYSDLFRLERGEAKGRGLSFDAPTTVGNYDLFIRVYNGFDTESMTTKINVGVPDLSAFVSANEITAGDFVRIWGFANLKSTPVSSVSVYKDGVLSSTVKPDSSGYYTAFVRFLEPGWHQVTARADGAEKSADVFVRAATTSTVTSPTSTTTSTAASAALLGTASDVPTGFVNIDVSSKEVDVEQYKGNLVNILVQNKLGRAETFKITTDLPEKAVFLPHAEIVKDGASTVFRVFISPGEDLGRIKGSLFVVQGTQTVKTIPVSTFVAPTPLRSPRFPIPLGFIGDIGEAGIGFLGGALVLTVVALYAKGKLPRLPLPFGQKIPSRSPLPLSPIGIRSAVLRPRDRREGQDIYAAAPDRIIG